LWGFPTNGFDTVPTCYNESFTDETTVTVTHNLNTLNVIVQVYSNNNEQIIPDDITTTSVNIVTVTFNSSQTGRIIIMGCEDS
jgi:hypothetical protein